MLGHLQRSSRWLRISLLPSQPWFLWLFAHILLDCVAMIMIIFNGTEESDCPSVPVCDLHFAPWMLSLLAFPLDSIFLTVFSVWLYKGRGVNGEAQAGKDKFRLLISIVAIFASVLDTCVFSILTYEIVLYHESYWQRDVFLDNFGAPGSQQWIALTKAMRVILVIFTISAALAVVSDVIWICNEVRTRRRLERLASIQRGTAEERREEGTDFTQLAAVKDIYNMESERGMERETIVSGNSERRV